MFFKTGYEVVKSIESRGSASSLGPAFTQFALVSATLREMSRLYAPILFVELNTTAEAALKLQPPQVADLIRTQSAMVNRTFLPKTDHGEAEISMATAISRGDFEEAERIVTEQKDENRAKALFELLRRAQVQYHLRRSDLYSALAAEKD